MLDREILDMHCLYIEDSRSDAILFVDSCAKAEIAVTVISSPLQIQSTNVNPDIVFTDLHFPSLTPTEALSIVCSNFPSLPVIVLTSDKSLRRQSRLQGANLYLTKEGLTAMSLSGEIKRLCAIAIDAQASQPETDPKGRTEKIKSRIDEAERQIRELEKKCLKSRQ